MVIESEIQGIGYSRKRGYHLVSIFGYTSKGLPGVEIIGPAKFTRTVKEKIIYICKKEKIRIPNKRHVICIDLPDQVSGDKDTDFFQWLELPLFLLLCNLVDVLPLHDLNGCLSMGKISIEELITIGIPPEKELLKIVEYNRSIGKYPVKLLNYKMGPVLDYLYHLPIPEILGGMQKLKFKEVVPDRFGFEKQDLDRDHFSKIDDLFVKS